MRVHCFFPSSVIYAVGFHGFCRCSLFFDGALWCFSMSDDDFIFVFLWWFLWSCYFWGFLSELIKPLVYLKSCRVCSHVWLNHLVYRALGTSRATGSQNDAWICWRDQKEQNTTPKRPSNAFSKAKQKSPQKQKQVYLWPNGFERIWRCGVCPNSFAFGLRPFQKNIQLGCIFFPKQGLEEKRLLKAANATQQNLTQKNSKRFLRSFGVAQINNSQTKTPQKARWLTEQQAGAPKLPQTPTPLAICFFT